MQKVKVLKLRGRAEADEMDLNEWTGKGFTLLAVAYCSYTMEHLAYLVSAPVVTLKGEPISAADVKPGAITYVDTRNDARPKGPISGKRK